jgi:hypothetical protein
MMPSVLTLASPSAPMRQAPNSLAPNKETATTSFDDDDWNW